MEKKIDTATEAGPNPLAVTYGEVTRRLIEGHQLAARAHLLTIWRARRRIDGEEPETEAGHQAAAAPSDG
jgi:hypothetical protein